MATGYVFTDTSTFRSDLNTEINAALYFRYEYTQTETSVTIQAISAGLVYSKARTTDPDSTFKVLKDSTATKNVITPDGKGHTATVTRTTNKNLTVTGSGSNFQSFGTFENMSYTVQRTTAAQAVQAIVSGTAIVSSDYAPTVIFTKSKSENINVPALTAYAVTLNANGGVNRVNSFTKYYGITAYFPSSPNLPTRTNYTFRGWASSSLAKTPAYTSGSAYTANAGATFYAIWSRVLYLTYNSNGGSGVSGSATQTLWNAATTASFTIIATKPTRPGYLFKGWSTSSTATSATYQPGGTINISSDTTLYAVWNPDPTLGVSSTSTENTYTIYTSVNAEVTRQVKIYENGTLISTNDVKGNNSFTFAGKRPETAYTIRVDLLDGSTVIATKTVTVSTVNADINLTGSNTDSTYTSVTALASGMKASSSFTKTIEWQYALASSPNDKTTFYSETLGTNATSNTAVITGLIPGRAYNVTAIYYVDGYQTDIKTISLSTNAISGNLSVTDKGVSTMIAALKNLTQLPYDIRVKVSYKEATASEWILKQTHDIYANAQVDIMTTISALKASTKYDIKADVVRASDSALIKTFTTQETTKAYVPGVAPTPFIDEYLVVPCANVAYIKWHVDGDMDGFTLELKEMTSSGTLENTYDVTELNGIKKLKKTKNVGSVQKYQIVAVDGNDEEHNPTEVFSLKYGIVDISEYTQGNKLDIKATRLQSVTDALLKAYTFRRTTQTPDPSTEEEQDTWYAYLKEAANQIAGGKPIKGTDGTFYSVIYAIGRYSREMYRGTPKPTSALTPKGAAISATAVNKNLVDCPNALFNQLRTEVTT